MTSLDDLLIAARGAFVAQWRGDRSVGVDWLSMLNTIPLVIVIAWLGSQSGRLPVVTYLAFGIFYLVLLNQSIVDMRWSVTAEARMGTLDFSLLSPVPLMAIMLGNAAALMASAARPALAAFVAGLVVSPGFSEVASPGWALVSGLVILLSLIATAFVLAPLTVVAGPELGEFRSTRPFVMAFSGLLYPVSLPPDSLEVIARLVPTSWAMGALIGSIETGHASEVAAGLITSLGLSAVYLALSAFMFMRIEARYLAIGGLQS